MIRISIAKKYFIAFTSIIVLPIVVVGYLLYRGYTGIVLQNVSNKSEELLTTISTQIEEKSREAQLILSTLATDRVNTLEGNRHLCELVSLWDETNEIRMRYELSKGIDNELDEIFSYINGLGSISFYLENEGFYFYRDYPEKDEILIRQEKWYKEAIENPGKAIIINSFENVINDKDNNSYISAVISPIKGNYENNVELILINMKIKLFNNIVKDKEYQLSSNTIILDKNDKVIFSKDKTLIGDEEIDNNKVNWGNIAVNDSVKLKINDDDFMVYAKVIPRIKWKIINLSNYNDIIKSINYINKISIVLIIIILVLFIIFSMYFLSGIIIPIHNLTNEMRKMRYGDLDVEVNIKDDGEIGELADTFNIMVKDLKNLIEENNNKERLRNEAEMEALQAQINPHFIANTLSSIRFMAMMAKMNNIREMTEAFINIVTASFNRNSKYNTIEKEIEMLRSYVYIMKVRHGNKYDVNFEVEEGIKDKLVLKMLIQPILENAILHGVSSLDYKGSIKVIFKNICEDLIVEVIDNGIGISKEDINRLLSIDCRNNKGFTSIGVKNVNKRIKLNFGEKYGIDVESIIGEYTRIKILMPIITGKMERE